MPTEYPPVVLGPEGLGSYEPPPVDHDKPLPLPNFGKRREPEPFVSPLVWALALFGAGMAAVELLKRLM